MFLITEVTNPGGASWTTPTIPQGYSGLLLRMVGDSAVAAGLDLIGLRMNGDSGAAKYRWQQLSATVATPTAAENAGAGVSYIDCGFVPGATAAHAGAVSTIDIVIPRYASTSYAKTVMVRNALFVAAASGGMVTYENKGAWMDTAAVTTLSLLLGTGPFAAPTWIGLYGLP